LAVSFCRKLDSVALLLLVLSPLAANKFSKLFSRADTEPSVLSVPSVAVVLSVALVLSVLSVLVVADDASSCISFCSVASSLPPPPCCNAVTAALVLASVLELPALVELPDELLLCVLICDCSAANKAWPNAASACCGSVLLVLLVLSLSEVDAVVPQLPLLLLLDDVELRSSCDSAWLIAPNKPPPLSDDDEPTLPRLDESSPELLLDEVAAKSRL